MQLPIEAMIGKVNDCLELGVSLFGGVMYFDVETSIEGLT